MSRYISLFLLIVSTWGQTINLSLEWTTDENFSLSNDLENLVSTQLSIDPRMSGIIIIHDGEIVLENYYGDNSQDSINLLWSATKTFTSTLIGQAVDMGLMMDPDSSASYFFQQFDEPYLDSISLSDLLSMSSGYEDDYNYPNWLPTDSLLSMDHSQPGTFFYNGSACELNSRAFYYSTGINLSEFAEVHLFPQLGIEESFWGSGIDGFSTAGKALALRLRDMAKLGQLYLQNGFSGDEQILSSQWIERATSVQTTPLGPWTVVPIEGTHEDIGLSGYGYLILLYGFEGAYLAWGWGGQIIAVIPEHDLVVATSSAVWQGVNESNYMYQIDLIQTIFNEIAPVFNNLSTNKNLIPEVLNFIRTTPTHSTLSRLYGTTFLKMPMST